MMVMEKEMKMFRLQVNIQNFNPVIPLIEMICGVLGFIVSLLIFLNM